VARRAERRLLSKDSSPTLAPGRETPENDVCIAIVPPAATRRNVGRVVAVGDDVEDRARCCEEPSAARSAAGGVRISAAGQGMPRVATAAPMLAAGRETPERDGLVVASLPPAATRRNVGRVARVLATA